MSPDDEDDALLATAELLDTRSANFDPTTRHPRQALRWHTAGRMSCARDGFACGELPDGRVVRGAGSTISSPTPAHPRPPRPPACTAAAHRGTNAVACTAP
jgi:hypothetical protein